ncbi:ribulose bisphosphate carboxylase/oxygenase activase, chloroplastic-like isoform X8 [Apium graveolens]|uniref:ribulose bisphosphate carboxylase/oxygenase activase, chloroplastic-like isoform X8 n=1 Tax=Apium graveolens TaxID=4045 RepID=UPI003D78D278
MNILIEKKSYKPKMWTEVWTSCNFKIVAEVDEEKQSSMDRWKGLAFDISDDQQDITRGKGMVDSLFQAPMNSGFTNSCTSRTVSYIKCI